MESKKYAREGYSIIVVGHEGHPEVIGTMGQSPDVSQLVDNDEDARIAAVSDPDRVVALTQTTLSVDDTHEIIGTLRERFPNILARNDICYATTNRQDAVKELAQRVDLVIVVGAQNSSNCNRLREVAEQTGVPSYLVDDASGIDPRVVGGHRTRRHHVGSVHAGVARGRGYQLPPARRRRDGGGDPRGRRFRTAEAAARRPGAAEAPHEDQGAAPPSLTAQPYPTNSASAPLR